MQRATMNVVFRAMSLLSDKAQPVRFVSSDEEAHAYINQLRTASRAQATKS